MNEPITNPLFQRAAFLSSAPDLAATPDDSGFEVAFAGRSNAGKSSAINVICHQKGLARTSKTPGRTQQLVFFRLDDERRLVDLPGYGFAKVSLAIKRRWQQLMERYLERRSSLKGLVVVMDIRHPLTDIDQQMIDWGIAAGLPLLLVLTKADKLKRSGVARSLNEVRKALSAAPVPVHVMAFSAVSRLGLNEAQDQIKDWLGLPAQVSGAVDETDLAAAPSA
ncbi:YihA family ribosome biogenesis GTP-binding protein [Lamprobacter modestohalophilus]|uniref:Probable GTP-binding protein EngB n=1 Tax=Lamprobacter modestohalophilus TaxID=1064514 RepID=A0A9X0W6T4_9GAMM|nr:ribosome biogenesis GTP-binding protein YihA/YsxC [Lamprobacter modestohalophilus]MBK1617932.1 YihA family ribosome biogenesis GTP-binding protein [Lamprobacter modestohalophilus]